MLIRFIVVNTLAILAFLLYQRFHPADWQHLTILHIAFFYVFQFGLVLLMNKDKLLRSSRK